MTDVNIFVKFFENFFSQDFQNNNRGRLFNYQQKYAHEKSEEK